MLISFICLWLLFARRHDWLNALTRAIILWTVEMMAFTELLSMVERLTLPGLLAFWLVSDLWLGVQVVRSGAWHLDGQQVLTRSKGFYALGLLCAMMGAMALLTVCYNWDCMTYHLPRICSWAQYGTVAHYPTNCVRQLSSPVLAEYVMLHVYLLTGKSDLFLNLVQWGSAVVCAVYSYGIAQKLEVKPVWSRLAALMTLSLPILFAEAFTAEADIYSALWLVLFAQQLLDIIRAPRLNFGIKCRHRVIWLALTVGFGYLAKPSICIAMVVLVAWMGIWRLVKKDKLADLIRLGMVAVVAVVLPMLPASLRNIRSFGALQSSSVSGELMVGIAEPRFLLANLSKHILGNLSNGYIPGSAGVINRLAADVGWVLGLNIDDDAISLANATFKAYDGFRLGNDNAGNPLFMALLLCAVGWCAVRILYGLICRKPAFTPARQYMLVSFAAFCAMGCTLRWQYWGTRLLMPFMVLCVPGMAAMIMDFAEVLLKKRGGMLAGLVCALCCLDLAVMVFTYHGPRLLAGRPNGYFAAEGCTSLYDPADYQAACDRIEAGGWQTVGLFTANDTYEYPVWAMLRGKVVKIGHVFGSADPGEYAPDVVFSVDRDVSGGLVQGGKEYSVIWQSGRVSLLGAD